MSNLAKPKGRRLSPLSIRLSEAERTRLRQMAGDRPLGSYVKSVLFSGAVRRQPDGMSRETAARLLALLGQSGLATNLARIAAQAEIGTLYCDDGLRTSLQDACADTRLMRDLLMGVLGKQVPKPGLCTTFARSGGAAP